jgi:hypothetical protein
MEGRAHNGLDLKTEEAFSWSVRLSDKAPEKRYGVLAAAILAGLIGVFVVGRPLLGLVGFAIILASTAEFWLGVNYRLTPQGASARCGLSLTAMDWEDVKRVLVDDEVVKLSPLAGDGRMDAFRGVSLRTLPENREQVLEYVKDFYKGDVRLLGN